MSTYIEVEMRCDGIPGNPFGCEPPIFELTESEARRSARAQGWLVSEGGKDYCPVHRPDAARQQEVGDA
jgi:hypothetical protein